MLVRLQSWVCSHLTYVEELIGSLLEPVTLTIVNQHGTLIDDWHLREALLGVQEGVKCGTDHAQDEESYHGVVLLHRVLRLVLFLRSAADS